MYEVFESQGCNEENAGVQQECSNAIKFLLAAREWFGEAEAASDVSNQQVRVM